MTLSFNRDKNILFIIICKFIKRIFFLFDHDIWKFVEWTNEILIDLLNHDWNISRVIISNKDFKFMSKFWKIVFIKLDTIMLIFIVYYSQNDEQSKRINQTIKIILRFHLIIYSNDEWINVIFFLQIENNNVTQTTIDHVFNELYYEFKINDIIDALVVDLSTKTFNKFRQLKRENVETIMTFVNAFNKTRYDNKHRVINIKKSDIIYLRLYQKYTISNLVNFKFSKQRVDFFEIFDKIDNLTFRLQLSFVMKIHSIVFIIQLKSITLD